MAHRKGARGGDMGERSAARERSDGPPKRARGHMGERSAASEGSDGPREKG